MEDKEDWKSDWITLEDEKGEGEDGNFGVVVDVSEVYKEYRERMKYLHRFHDLNEEMYPECKGSDRPSIMDEVGLFRMGFYSSDKEFRYLTKSTLTKILKNFVDYSSLTDSLFTLGNVKFLTKLFDIEEVWEQVRIYLVNRTKNTGKGKDFVLCLETMLKYPYVNEDERRVISELLRFLHD